MSIIPGIENAAPERTLTSSGSAGSPRVRCMNRSRLATWWSISASRSPGQPVAMNARQASVVMVKPGGTGSASTEVISARLAPLPPSRAFRSLGARL